MIKRSSGDALTASGDGAARPAEPSRPPIAPGAQGQGAASPALREQELNTLANDLRRACQHVARRVRFESTSELPPHQMSVLMWLNHAGPQTPTQIAERERVSTPSVTRTLNCLVEEGCVLRSPHPDDRRQILVSVTPRGAELVERTIAERDTWMLRRLSELGSEDLALARAAADLLSQLADGTVGR
ncbi:DNA-binding transcriptional regulator, MarR family [Propionibacterium cyclohexanicum]|uniref:DNA-binding transcriptional regulator, MarR family n=1 Tax=Propionibacterium cyclohexanicum TaxID=64702 RepID=A0A1H9REZ5_9ACTN|nr:MarR family transcriptional regulator [Propionibacterium cyclohexanicum]SER71125.1 DNA-binding transcriptional regulator, MarR family [Propionibacterium cyclohexanicum]